MRRLLCCVREHFFVKSRFNLFDKSQYRQSFPDSLYSMGQLPSSPIPSMPHHPHHTFHSSTSSCHTRLHVRLCKYRPPTWPAQSYSQRPDGLYLCIVYYHSSSAVGCNENYHLLHDQNYCSVVSTMSSQHTTTCR